MKRFIFIWFVLFQDTFSLASPCLTDHQICRKRSSMIYQLDKALTEINKACGREPSLYIDWKSFEPILAGKDTYSVDACMLPLAFFTEYCEANFEQAKKLLNTVEGFECVGTGVDKQAISFKTGVLKFMMDPTNDWRSDRKGPAVSGFVTQEMKSIFEIGAATKQEVQQAKRNEQIEDKRVHELDMAEKRRRAEKDRELEQKKQQEQVKATVAATNENAKKKAEVFQAETKRLTEWMQSEMKKIQGSGLSPEEKGKKMTEMSQKYQADLEKASKAYNGGQ
jgi:hypothetical protein